MNLQARLIQLSLLILLWAQGLCPLKSDGVTNASWYLPRPIVGYKSYLDVYPVRYDIPMGLSHVLWSFETSVNPGNCGNNKIYILLQHSGLPLIQQNNLTFPDNFVVPKSPTISFSMEPGRQIMISVLRPPLGSWYALAYMDGVDKQIRQKGLTSSDECVLSYKSHIEMGEPIQRQQVFMKQENTLLVHPQGSFISFTVPTNAYAFDLAVTDCDGPADCSITLEYIPFNTLHAVTQKCDNVTSKSEPCVLHVPSPPYLDEQLIVFRVDNSVFHRVTFLITPQECSTSLGFSDGYPCLSLPSLDRLNLPQPFFAAFGHITMNSVMTLVVPLAAAPIVVMPFDIKEPNDVGSTLKWQLKADGSLGQNMTDAFDIHLCGAIIYNSLPDMSGDDFDVCANASDSVALWIPASGANESMLFVPYPRVGVWHLMVQATCYLLQNDSQIPCPANLKSSMALELKPCKDDACEGRGECLYKTVGSDLVTMASCKCAAGYQGYACTDGSHALSNTVQLAGALLLTLSNLCFIPSIIIAIRRKFYLEAFVYFYTMFFSTFYHACDGDRIDQYRKCIMPFDVLQSGDFFGSSCSLWITLVAMAQINVPRVSWMTPLLQILGPFGLIIGVIYDKTSLYVIAIPIACGVLTIICSWAYKMYKRKRLYPSLKRYLFFLAPGVALAATGAALFVFIETEDNYKYVHSVWHVSIALSICLLLPPRNFKRTDEGTNTTAYLLNSMEIGHDTPQTS